MYLSNEGILMILLVGLIAGWLAGKIVRGTGIGLIGDMAIGIVGAFSASWLLPRLGIGLLRADLGDHQCHHRRDFIADNCPARSSITATSVGVSSPPAPPTAVLYGAEDHMRRDRDHLTAIEDNPSSEGNDDPHDELSALRSLLPDRELRKFILTSNFSLGQSAWAGMQP